jgi:hypothetical protein
MPKQQREKYREMLSPKWAKPVYQRPTSVTALYSRADFIIEICIIIRSLRLVLVPGATSDNIIIV